VDFLEYLPAYQVVDSDTFLRVIMIETFEGRLGGGKTYTAVQRMLSVLCSGGYVATNIKLMVEPWDHDIYGPQSGLRAICKGRGWDLKDEQIINLPDYEYVDFKSRQDGKVFRLSKLQAFWTLIPRVEGSTILVVIDEAHFHFPQSGYRSIPNDVVEFLTLSRHARVDIIFISQHIKNMWCQMSRLAQYRWEFRDMKKHGMYIKGNFPIPSFTLPWPFPHILQSQYDYDGKTLIAKFYDWHNTKIHECYTSPDLLNAFASAGSVQKFSASKRGLTMKEKWFITATGAFLASIVWGVVYFKNPRVQMVTVEKVVTNTVEVASFQPGVSSPDPEYCTGYIIGAGTDRLYTTRRIYSVLDRLDDGSVILEILPDALRIARISGQREIISFSAAPKVAGSVSAVPVPFKASSL